ncbi:MAG: carboxypeptidase regulatory-like domain-containing protein [Acidobacteria bacterium]|nr:carboxypeptidase regulatory-like domain-containing protein [Acidobacteriota bacterium]
MNLRPSHPGTKIALLALLCLAGMQPAVATPVGRLSGVVVDGTGTPQMGATILVQAENHAGAAALQFLTNSKGVFSAERLLPGLYSVRVTLAGFLPAVQQHVRIDANLATMLKVELDSLFASIDRLRRKPMQQLDSDEWAWILRTAPSTRPVLRYEDGQITASNEPVSAEKAKPHKPMGHVELTSGSRHPGSVANQVDTPSSVFAYSQKLGNTSRLVMAGQVGYEQSAAAGFTATWLPAGEPGRGAETTLVMRQSNLGPGGPAFRGASMRQLNQHRIGDRVHIRYGADYTVETLLGRSSVSVRPHGELGVDFGSQWRAAILVASAPSAAPGQPSDLTVAQGNLESLPAVMWRNGRPVQDSGWHQELNVEHLLGAHASIVAAVFRDRSAHTAVYGRGGEVNPEFFHDVFSDTFVYDGGESNTWGTRVAYRQKINDEITTTVVYAWAGTLSPEEAASSVTLRDALQTSYRHSLAAHISGRIPKLGTRFSASYKWINGPAVTRQDRFGEASFDVDPNLNISFRQPLPEFLFFSGKFQAIADFRNLLARGYVPVSSGDGNVILLPAMRTIRGGFSFQF